MAAADTWNAHNADVRALWAGYRRGTPARVPVTFSCNPRMILLDPALNPKGITPRRFCEDPEVMWDMELRFRRWLRERVVQDAEMGPPAEWPVAVNFFNSYEAGWFGAPLWYPDDDLPDTKPLLADKEALSDLAPPDPFHGGLMGRAYEFYEAFEAKRARGDTFDGRPVGRPWLPTGTDGPFTVACNLRGATELCADLVEDERYARALLEFVTDNCARRMRAWKALAREAPPGPDGWFWFADDAIAMLSADRYRAQVLPFHRRLVAEFRGAGRLGMHLCGAVEHLLPTLVRELGVASFELGFPVDLGRVRAAVGEDVELIGNVHPDVLRSGPTACIAMAVRRICTGGAMRGGKLILREGNNVAPRTPPAHFAAMLDAAKAFAVYKCEGGSA